MCRPPDRLSGRAPRNFCPMSAKVLLNLGLISVNRPAKRRPLVDGVFDIQSCSPLDKQPDNRVVAGQSGLMERRRVGMVAVRVVPAGVFAGIKKQLYDLHMSVLRGERHRTMPAFRVG